MKAIILAAGKSPVTDGAISSIDVWGHPLVDIQAACLRAVGVEEIVLVGGHRSEEVGRADIHVVYNEAWRETGSVGSLMLAAGFFDGEHDILIVYGDTIFDTAALEAVLRAPGPIASLCFLDRAGRDIGHFREYALVEDGTLKHVSGAATESSVRTVFTGIVRVAADKSTALRAYLEEGGCPPAAHLGELVNFMIDHGVDVMPVIVERGWVELGSVGEYEALLQDETLVASILPIHADWERRSRLYDKLDWVNNDQLLCALTTLAKTGQPKRVLDMGTGTGKVLLALKVVLDGAELWGIDQSEAMLARIPNREGLVLRRDKAETLSTVPDESFDLVTARMLLHHVAYPAQAVASAARVLRPGGQFIVCEGVPPSLRSIKWYTDMFRYKEDRNTMTEVDLIGLLAKAEFDDITTYTVTLREVSLNNWLGNAGIPEENVAKIKDIHFGAPDYVREDYDMRFADGDCFMTWRFAIVCGRRP